MNAKLSIIIPIYKTEKYLERCVNSVINQYFKGMEIILVDDGSPDNCPEICNNYVNKYDYIHVIHKSNSGLGFARNSGAMIASGEYITFLDSDDFVENDYYEKFYNYSNDNNLDVCIASHFLQDTNGEIKKIQNVNGKYIGRIMTDQREIKELSCKVISPSENPNDFFGASVCFTLYKRDFYNSNNLSFKSEYEFLSEDLDFSIDVYQKALRVSVLDIAGYHYWYNEESYSRGYNPNRFSRLTQTVHQLEEKCSKLNLKNYEGRIARYYWVNLEKCINQEFRYKKNRREAICEIKAMSDNQLSRHYLLYLYNNHYYKGLQYILCLLLVKQQYSLVACLLKLYNFLFH